MSKYCRLYGCVSIKKLRLFVLVVAVVIVVVDAVVVVVALSLSLLPLSPLLSPLPPLPQWPSPLPPCCCRGARHCHAGPPPPLPMPSPLMSSRARMSTAWGLPRFCSRHVHPLPGRGPEEGKCPKCSGKDHHWSQAKEPVV